MGPSCGTSCLRSIARIYRTELAMRTATKKKPRNGLSAAQRCTGARTHLVDARQVRAEPAVHAEDTPVDDSSEGEVVEDLAAVAPDVRGAVLALALVEEAVHLRDLPRLVVPPDERDPVGVSYFVGEQQEEGLDGVEPAVDEVAYVCGGCL